MSPHYLLAGLEHHSTICVGQETLHEIFPSDSEHHPITLFAYAMEQRSLPAVQTMRQKLDRWCREHCLQWQYLPYNNTTRIWRK
jgi:hypothetical protein